MARHKSSKPVKTGLTGRHVTFGVIGAISATIILYLWLAPAAIIPLPKQERDCVITDSHSIRLHTTDCGTLYTRIPLDLEQWAHYKTTTTGPIVWNIKKK